MAISLNTRVSQSVNLTPQLQQSIRLLQLSNSELEQELAKAAEDNPLIELNPIFLSLASGSKPIKTLGPIIEYRKTMMRNGESASNV
jgi:DNA-directed RNA polymerase specialized sigma54-like protein